MTTDSSQTQYASSPWWGDHEVMPGDTKFWQIGPLQLWIERDPNQWRLSIARTSDALDGTTCIAATQAHCPKPPPDAESERLPVEGQDTKINIAPCLADRSVVSRPSVKLRVPPGERAQLLLSTPVWIRVTTGAREHTLLDVPAFRPSDTWFGPDLHTGELCYASRTHCRTKLEDFPLLPHRCITAVSIHNRSDTDLPVERINLPMKSLAIFAGSDARLWTPDITLERRSDDQQSEIIVSKSPPGRARDAVLVAQPRRPLAHNVMLRAIGSLFS